MIDINGRYDHYPFSEQLPINILYLACRTGEILFGTFDEHSSHVYVHECNHMYLPVEEHNDAAHRDGDEAHAHHADKDARARSLRLGILKILATNVDI